MLGTRVDRAMTSCQVETDIEMSCDMSSDASVSVSHRRATRQGRISDGRVALVTTQAAAVVRVTGVQRAALRAWRLNGLSATEAHSFNRWASVRCWRSAACAWER